MSIVEKVFAREVLVNSIPVEKVRMEMTLVMDLAAEAPVGYKCLE